MKTKKILAAILAIALLLTALVIPAMAEETTNTAQSAAVTAKGGPQGQMPGNRNQNGPRNQQGGMGGSNMPPQGQMPGNGSQNAPQQGQQPDASTQATPQQGQQPGSGNQNSRPDQRPGKGMRSAQTPAAADQNAAQPQTPAANDQNTQAPGNSDQNAQTPAAADQNAQASTNGNQKPQKGRMPGKNGFRGGKQDKSVLNLSELVEKNIIDQETATRIEEYLKNNAPAQAAANGTTPPEKPEGNNGTTPPEKPDGDQAGPEGTTPPELPVNGEAATQDDLLAKLVEAGVLTQEQADAITALNTTTTTETAETNTEEVGG